MKNVLVIGILLKCSVCCFSQNSFNGFTDEELIKLAKHIKSLEAKTPNLLTFKALYSNSEDSGISSKDNNFKNGLTDLELIKLANYIKALELNLQNMSLSDEVYNQTIARNQTTKSMSGVILADE